MYEALCQVYTEEKNEVDFIEGVVNSINGQSYNGVKIFAAMIHGSHSFVEFDFMNTRVTKKLGDMIVIALASDGKTLLFQKVCVVQNKKAPDAGRLTSRNFIYSRIFLHFRVNKAFPSNARIWHFETYQARWAAMGCFSHQAR